MSFIGNALHTVLIWPIELLLAWCLYVFHLGTQSYGLAIIGVSAVVSTLTLPLYRYADGLQRKERAIQATLAPKIQELQKRYKGGELYEAMNVVYKEHNYHPIHASRASLGVMIQIPFFLAAYNFLAGFEPLRGQGFLVIADLGQPDALLALGGVTLNVLPVLMTVFNLLAGVVASRQAASGEKFQMWLIAAAFLILLYGAPAGLLLYWTCNNLYSLARNTIIAKK